MFLHTDTETTGIPLNGVPSNDPRHPHLVSLTSLLDSDPANTLDELSTLIKPDGYRTEDFPEAFKIHGITTERAMDEGQPLPVVMGKFIDLAKHAEVFAAYSAHFDFKLLKIASARVPNGDSMRQELERLSSICTMEAAAMHLIGKKRMKLKDAYWELFHEEIQKGDHASYPDAMASRRIFWELHKRKALPDPKPTLRTYETPYQGDTKAATSAWADTKINEPIPLAMPAAKRKPAAL